MTDTDNTFADPTLLTGEDVADGEAAIQRTFATGTIGQTIVLDGFGVVVRVARGELELVDGIGPNRRQRRIARAQAAGSRVGRILVLGTGTVTTDAHAWCHAMGITLVITGSHGEPLSIGSVELFDHGGLRRAQALAPFTDAAMNVTRYLLAARLGDQARLCRHRLRRVDRAEAIDALRPLLAEADTVGEAMVIEMQAAEHYWAAWTDEVRLAFAARDRPRVPGHWSAFGGRSSPLGEAPTNRHAATPLNALINFGMRLAEIEVTIACRALGLDPAMGLAHADGLNRPAFVLDLMEPVRGTVEEMILRLAAGRVFRKADFAELPTGEIRVLAPLSHDLAAELLPALREAVAPFAEHVAAMLSGVAPSAVVVPTPLTRSRHKRARADHDDTVRNGPSAGRSLGRLWTCPDCGGVVTDPQRVRCDTCIDQDPQQTPQVRGRRAKAIAARRRAAAAWEAAGGEGTFDPEAWPGIQVGLADVKLADIVAATGFAKSFASVVRAGKSRPHPSHWPALAALSQPDR